MKRTLTFGVVLWALAGAWAGDGLPLIQPAGHGMVLAKPPVKGERYAEFTGRIWVTGTLVAQWVVGVDETEANTFEVLLVPDASSIGRLPHFKGYPVEDIIPENPKAALRLAFDETTRRRLERKDVLVAKAPGFFQLARYVVGVECDSPWSRSMIVGVKVRQPLIFASDAHENGCG
jgi:hypothetical protein